jgi:hypothetical protein
LPDREIDTACAPRANLQDGGIDEKTCFMIWTDTAGELPAPRDDEPPQLRQDIHDELADHLESAMERELRQSTDEGAARERVLERFGDPRRVARKLWQDAMWEKLMSQRILIGMAGMIMAASFGMFWMTWTIAQQGREMNAALLARLDRIEQQPVTTNTPEWNPASVQLATASGEPLPAGFKVQFVSKDFQLEQPVDAKGRVNLGLQRPGSCIVGVSAPWGEVTQDDNTPIRAGEPYAPRIVCPTAPDLADAPLELHWPEGLDSPDIWLACSIQPKSRSFAGRDWRMTETYHFFVDHSGRTMLLTDEESARGSFLYLFQSIYSPPGEREFAAPLRTSATLKLPAHLDAEVHAVPVRIQNPLADRPGCTQLCSPSNLPFKLVREASLHWSLTIPAEMKQQVDRLADQGNSLGYELNQLRGASLEPAVAE